MCDRKGILYQSGREFVLAISLHLLRESERRVCVCVCAFLMFKFNTKRLRAVGELSDVLAKRCSGGNEPFVMSPRAPTPEVTPAQVLAPPFETDLLFFFFNPN